MQTELRLNRLAGSAGKTETTGDHSGVHCKMEKQDPSCYRSDRRLSSGRDGWPQRSQVACGAIGAAQGAPPAHRLTELSCILETLCVAITIDPHAHHLVYRHLY